MKRVLLITIAIFCLVGCKKEKIEKATNNCGVTKPIEELPWLKDKIAQMQQYSPDMVVYSSMKQGNYNGETVFFEGNCCPNCFFIAAFFVYKCDGTLVSNLDFSKITDIKTIWKPEGYQCTDAN